MFILLGYGIGFFGFFLGAAVVTAIHRISKRILGTMMGFSAGLLIAFVCFELVATSVQVGGLPLNILGLLTGVFLIMIFEDRIQRMDRKVSVRSAKFTRMGIMLAAAMCLHNIPEGMAVGALLQMNLRVGLEMGLLVMLHRIPEGITYALALKEAGVSKKKTLLSTFLLAIPMCVGCCLGYLLGGTHAIVLAIGLSVSAGVMMYVTCGEILPTSREIWNGRMSTIGALAGFIIGVALVLHG